MNITLHTPEECTLADWCDRHSLHVIVVPRDGGGYLALVDRGDFDIGSNAAHGVSPERAVRQLARAVSCGVAMIDGRPVPLPKLTGIRDAGDWERFTV